jgi:hypothetical protein
MDPSKPAKTLADYMVIAISPALIMVLVHSLCFFLVEVFYRGEAAGGVRWVLFWFVLAVVLIARIGIEQGAGHALGYGLALALATWVYLSTVQPHVIFSAILLGVVWFTAHKITCNCTLIDDDVDASGQGLMQSLPPLRRLASLFKKNPPQAAGDVASTPAPRPSGKGIEVRLLGAKPQMPRPPAPSTAKSAKKKASSEIPGVWLIYFSLAALPLFGLGQMLLPAGDLAARHQGFVYLFFYLAAALGLMIATSFLGLRRYLRQRYLVMPGNIAVGWIQFGAVAAALVLGLALLLPRPGAGEAWGALRYHVDYQLRRASNYAARFNPHGTGSGRAGNQAPPAGQPENNPPQTGPSSGQNQNENPGAKGPDGQQPGPASDRGTPAGKAGGNQPGKPLPELSPTSGSLYAWVKALFWLAAALGLAWLLYRYRALILTLLRSVWAALRNFIATLLGWFQSPATAPAGVSKAREVRSFNTFKNPFLTGGDRVWSPEKLITYSYDALQSWAMEQEAARGSPQTPREFCRQLGEEIPEAATALEHLAFFYGHVAYGASVPGSYNSGQLRLVWDYMANPRPGPAPVPVPGS